MDEMTKLMINQLKDAYSAEKQALRGMQKMMRNASNEMLKEGFRKHIEETEGQIGRVEQALEQLGGKPGRKVCEAMRGLIEEANHEMEEAEKGPHMDVVIVAAAQRIEHYEIAAYGTMATLAKSAGMKDLGTLMGQTLAEEKQADATLTEVAVSEVNPAFIEMARAGEEEMATANENRRGGARRKAS
jgi:ferritin-like metal-binding protein YciE